MARSIDRNRWKYTSPTLKTWRGPATGTTHEEQVVKLLRKAFKDGSGLIIDRTEKAAAVMPHRDAAWHKLERFDNYVFEAEIKHRKPVDDQRNRTYYTDTYTQQRYDMRRAKLFGDNTGWAAGRHAVFGVVNNQDIADMDALQTLARYEKAKNDTHDVVNNLEMLLSGMLGLGFTKKTEEWGYGAQRTITLEYKGCTVEISSDGSME